MSRMTHPLLRASAVVFSATLLIGFVVFRTGGCAGERTSPVPITAPATTQATLPVFEVMPGSKSGRLLPPAEADKFRTMAGSKSMVLVDGAPALIVEGTPPATLPTTEPAR